MNENKVEPPLNHNCLIFKRTNTFPFRRCQLCTQPFRNCFMMQASGFIVALLLLILIVFTVEHPVLHRTGMVLIIALLLSFLVVINKRTDEMKQTENQLRTMNLQLKEEIAERSLIEQALHESKDRLNNIWHSIPSGIVIVDAKTHEIVDANPCALALIGGTLEQAVGSLCYEFFCPTEKGNCPITDLNRTLDASERLLVKRDGSKVSIQKTVVPLIQNGREYLVESFVDLTDRKRVELAISKANSDLEKRVEIRTAELAAINDKLMQEIEERKIAEKENKKLVSRLRQAEKMEIIGTLAGGVAHDLNNVLSGLVSYPDLLLMDLPPDSALIKPIQTIKNSGEKAATIVQDLLTMARRGVSTLEVLNLNEVVSEYLLSNEYQTLQSHHYTVRVETSLHPDLFNIMGSPVHLSKTLMNLVANAAEAMPGGGVIKITTANRYIDHPLTGHDPTMEGEYVVLKISDTGIGISENDMARIYEPFYTKKVMGRSGTGLGMAVVWGTVKDHYGFIDSQSVEGKGTTFALYLPVTRKEMTQAPIPPIMQDYRGQGESILVVDDVREQREIATNILRKLGYVVTAVASGEYAISYMHDHPVDLLLLDMIMDPGINGLATYKRILKTHPKQKAIIASGFSRSHFVKEAQKLGAGAYIRKPYALHTIGLAVKTELSR